MARFARLRPIARVSLRRAGVTPDEDPPTADGATPPERSLLVDGAARGDPTAHPKAATPLQAGTPPQATARPETTARPKASAPQQAGTPAEATASPETTAARPQASAPLDATARPEATVDPVAEPEAAAVDPAPDASATSYRDRARLRRRLRYLRRARELAFRDLGGFVFDAHRFGRHREDIVAAKLKGLSGMDAELRSLETALDDRRELMLLHEPGISVCPRCATLHASDANFCSGCGLPRGGAALPLGPRAPFPVGETPDPAQPTTKSRK